MYIQGDYIISKHSTLIISESINDFGNIIII